jgi:hypothetical protein
MRIKHRTDARLTYQILLNFSITPDAGGGRNGGWARTRTVDPLIKSQLLYQLSYTPKPFQSSPGVGPQDQGGGT